MSGLLKSVKYLTAEAKERNKRVIKNTDSGLRRVELKTEIKGTLFPRLNNYGMVGNIINRRI